MRTSLPISAAADGHARVMLRDVEVDSECVYSWIPGGVLDELRIPTERVQRFKSADGLLVDRSIGFASLAVGERFAPTPVVFAEEGDRTVLGGMALSGLGLRVDTDRQELVAAGPLPAPSNVLV